MAAGVLAQRRGDAKALQDIFSRFRIRVHRCPLSRALPTANPLQLLGAFLIEEGDIVAGATVMYTEEQPDTLSLLIYSEALNVLAQVERRLLAGYSTAAWQPALQVTPVREEWNLPLPQTMLFHWHTLVMRGSGRVNAGAWRTHQEPMQVIPGPA